MKKTDIKRLEKAAEEYSLGHSVRKQCFIDGALWMKEKLKRNDTKNRPVSSAGV